MNTGIDIFMYKTHVIKMWVSFGDNSIWFFSSMTLLNIIIVICECCTYDIHTRARIKGISYASLCHVFFLQLIVRYYYHIARKHNLCSKRSPNKAPNNTVMLQVKMRRKHYRVKANSFWDDLMIIKFGWTIVKLWMYLSLFYFSD